MRLESPETTPYRPPSELGSILLRVTRNCWWNRCRFCGMYKDERFEIIGVGEVKENIDKWSVVIKNINEDDEYRDIWNYLIGPYISPSRRTVFIGDSDSLMRRTSQMVEILEYLHERIPGIERVTSYARAATLVRKKSKELKEINEARLNRLHVGLETGYGPLLEYIEKGATPEEMILAGRKAKEAGFEYCKYVILGLGGKKWTEYHAKATAEVLNQINPDQVRFRTLIPRPNAPLFKDYESGRLQLLTPHETLKEARTMIERLDVESTLYFDHNSNPIPPHSRGQEYKLPEQKEDVLGVIEIALTMDESSLPNVKNLIHGLV